MLQAFWGRVRACLVDDWRQAWRWWSIRLGAASGLSFLLSTAEPLLSAWSLLPPESRGLLPETFRWIALALAGFAFVARILKQKEKDDV
ncbi:DUF7940 domain-containing protein [Stakelama tenebrarum]|uniref:Holin n=1 Tax=Stakelama tenebrarum TaxID=2711215 RepID=A0A6G6Y5D1_9SPHN|nr:hypothetical protein [Sphingosinithalassobacter tenebrarum]QIG80125.1 hypothetical protein G5C33_10255 [Sphingosinithalassobacter tenebrarum]